MTANTLTSRFTLRLPQALKEKLELAARQSNLSVNAEILKRISLSFTPQLPRRVAEPKLPYQLAAKTCVEAELLSHFHCCSPHMQQKIFLLTRDIATLQQGGS